MKKLSICVVDNEKAVEKLSTDKGNRLKVVCELAEPQPTNFRCRVFTSIYNFHLPFKLKQRSTNHSVLDNPFSKLVGFSFTDNETFK